MSNAPSNDSELNKLIEELDKPVEEENISKKPKKESIKDKKNDDFNEYDYSEDIDLSDNDW